MSITDLHVHSSFSDDADFPVRGLLAKAVRHGVKYLAITDHNCARANEEALALAAQFGINVIAGIELDCVYRNVNLHLLGYNIDWRDNRYTALEQQLREQAQTAFPEMLKKLELAGVAVDAQAVLTVAGDKVPCGEHIAEAALHSPQAGASELLRPYLPGGSRSDMPYVNFYWDYFSQGKPAYVETKYMDLKEALEMVLSGGGIPVLAHPGANLKNNPELIDGIIAAGIAGIEIYNNYHTPEQTEYFGSKAADSGLLVTCGSDFHGRNKPLVQIGQCDNDAEEAIAQALLAL